MKTSPHYRSRSKLASIFLTLLSILIITPPPTLHALTNSKLDFFADTGIMFYDPDASYNCASINSPYAISNSPTSGDYSALKQAVRSYGLYAMDLQRQYGSPWELIFAQMQKESGTGTAQLYQNENGEWLTPVNIQAENKGGYNWLGITGSGDTGIRTANGSWAVFTSIEAMMNAWAGTKVLRSGRYDAAFQHTDPNNYDLDAFIDAIVPIYAPATENNVPGYISDVKSIIRVAIADVRAEQDWPSSAELASKDSISIGGENPLNVTIDPATPTSLSPWEDCPTVSPGTITPGGITTLSAAEFILDAYQQWRTNNNIDDSQDCNCVYVIRFFIDTYSSKAFTGTTGDGHEVVRKLGQAGFPTGTDIHPYSVYSTEANQAVLGSSGSQYGHTAVILGITDDGQAIVFESGCGGTWHDGIIHTRAISKYQEAISNGHVTFAYLESYLKDGTL
jgi:hypothetical protein